MSLELPVEGMVPYPALFPKTKTAMPELRLMEKVGKARAGSYLVIEHYCVVEDCDCRRVALQLIDEKGRQKAVIDLPLDIDTPFGVPVLNEEAKQSAAAEGLFEIAIEVLEEDPDWFREICRRYRAVRKKVTGKAYRGRPFPPRGPIWREGEEEEVDVETMMNQLAAILPDGGAASGKGRKSATDPRQQSLFPEAESGGPLLSELIAAARRSGKEFADYQQRQRRVREYLMGQPDCGEELAEALLGFWGDEDESGLDAALTILSDALEILRVDLERRRPQAAEGMEQLQAALARQVFAPGVDIELGNAVTGALLATRVEILPVLHEANSRRIEAGLDDYPMDEFSAEAAVEELLANLDEIEVENAFELVDALLQMLAVGEADAQTALCYQLLLADAALARDAAVLMLFHPRVEVREGVAEMLAQADGTRFTPESLRRMILARNWFPEAQRKRIDQAIANARRARVDCAPLSPRGKVKTYASAVDGARAQMLQFVVPQGQGYFTCMVMPKEGVGVADVWLGPLPDKRELNRFLKQLGKETGCTEASRTYLDRRICEALAEGAAAGRVPGHWLVAVAELLGCDQWRAIPFDGQGELARLVAQLPGKLSDAKAGHAALTASATWPERKTFAYSWFEDDVEVDDLLDGIFEEDEPFDPMRPLLALFEGILEPRRQEWLALLVQAARWLEATAKPPVPWAQMVHVAAAVADPDIPLQEIPLMIAVAEQSVGAYIGRLDERG